MEPSTALYPHVLFASDEGQKKMEQDSGSLTFTQREDQGRGYFMGNTE